MIFINYIKFKNGKLSRGERCLYKGHLATYLGSYVEKSHTVDMIRIEAVTSEISGIVVIEQFIEQCTNRGDIVCLAQQEKPIEGQMQLC